MAWGWFFLVVFLILLVYAGWAGFKFFSAKRQGLPPPPPRSYIPFMGGPPNTNYPTPRSSGPLDWIKDKFAAMRNKGPSRGTYQEAGDAEHGLTSGRRGRGLEDEAWDAQVGHEDLYDAGRDGHYDGQDDIVVSGPPGYEPHGANDYTSANTEYTGATARGANENLQNPFGDEYRASSMRSVSPRPEIDTSKARRQDSGSIGSAESSPTSGRKSAFHERI